MGKDLFKKGETYFGFKLIEKENVTDIDSLCYVFEHEKSGARLMYADNNDENKVFFAAFKTPPLDDCGTAHILEHSVLCGSAKYPAKDPFNELMKGSLNTYLNAMTFADKTMYPVASCNHEDFKKLTDVYLDAVFNPMVIKEEKIFKQEGWHYELPDEASDITINGVVYNEMKGAFSSPERVLSNAINQSLFPESIYRFESGGDPAAIPQLSYENFVDFYHLYYHPSNSYLYLYGDMDIEFYLKHLDESYLCNYTRSTNRIEIAEEKEHSRRELVSDTFSVPLGTKTGNESLLSLNFLIGKSTDTRLALAMKILNYVLLETEASPLKKVLVEKRIAESVEGWFDTSTYQMVFSVVAKNSTCKKVGLFKETVFTTLQELAEKGLDKDLLIAAVNKYEFLLKEADYGYRPKGLTYGIGMMKGWLHGQSPIHALKIKEHIDFIRDGIETGYFESLLKQYFLQSNNSSIAAIAADEGKQEREEERLKASLAKLKESLTPQERAKLIAQTKELIEYQNTPDTAEDIEKIPTLKREDIDTKAKFTDYRSEKNLLIMEEETNGIDYVKLLFSTEAVPQELVPYAGILVRAMGKLGTENLSGDVLSTQINQYLGGFSGHPIVFSAKDGYKPVLAFNVKALESNRDIMFRLINEIILRTDLTASCALKKLMLDMKSEQELFLNNNGHLVAVSRCKAMLSESGYYQELIDNLDYNDTLLLALENMDETCEKLKQTAEYIFNRQNLTTVLCGKKENINALKAGIKALEEGLPCREYPRAPIRRKENILKEAVENGDKIVYNAKASNYQKAGVQYNGKMEVVKHLVNREYLWKEVRVKGGAYGCGCNFDKNGKFYFYSYRDPNIQATFCNFDKAAQFLKEVRLSDKELTKYMLGAINDIDRPESISTKIQVMTNRHFLGLTRADIQQSRDELLSITVQDLKEYGALFQKMMAEAVYCTFGSNSLIGENAGLYDVIRPAVKK